ncbi:hypothetical protein [Lutimonas sp.]|uniref:hypothetical protein n=1 Tax=Lutimonas sp. TaxID=1872403 RepID=UPI003D9B6B5F
MKNYTILAILAFIALNACKKESTTTTTDPVISEIISSAPATSEPTLESYKKGEKWVWLEKSVAEGRIRWEGKELQEVVAFKGSLGFWNGKDTILISNTLNQEQSSTPYRSWPLKVGKKWKYESDWKNSEGTPMKTSMDVEVVSYEEEFVLAGRFMAFKIEYKGTITNSIGGSSDFHEVYWYAPELKVNIKKAQNDGYGSYMLELYDYKKEE